MRTAIDLFAGAGGATAGLRLAGFDVLAAAENDPVATRSFAANHLDVVMAGDVRSMEPGRLRRYLGLQRGDLDLLKACPPCQGFSSLSRGQTDSDRNDLVLDVYRFMRDLAPRALLLENVPGLCKDERLKTLTDALARLGYRHAHYIVDAQQFGVPQRRRRLIVLAIRGDMPRRLPENLVHGLPKWFDVSRRSAGEALAALAACRVAEDPQDRFRASNETVRARIAAIPIGGGRVDLPEEYRLACHSRLTRNGRPASGQATSSYGRIRAGDVAPTMTTRCTTPACGAFVHPTEDRGLTLREAATLQTFPTNYVFEGGYDAVERQIGNAVPVRMAQALGLAVLRLFGDNTPEHPAGSPAGAPQDSTAARRTDLATGTVS